MSSTIAGAIGIGEDDHGRAVFQSRSKAFECRLYNLTIYDGKSGVERRNFHTEWKRLEGYVDSLLGMHDLLSQHWGRKLGSTPQNPGMDFHVQFMRQQKEVLQRKIQEVIDELKEFIHFVYLEDEG